MQSEYVMDALDAKLNEAFDGKVVRKDLLHRIKKGTNVPTFVLEFLLARYCASNDPAEIDAGMEAVLSTLQENYVRPDEANAAQSTVAMKGKHKFIDKVHVRYVEKEKRHWASLENFDSQRIAIGEKFYRDNDRLLEGGIWAEVTHRAQRHRCGRLRVLCRGSAPDPAQPIRLRSLWRGRDGVHAETSGWTSFCARSAWNRRSSPQRVKLHFIARLAPLVEPNFNFIELGPRGTGKSYFFSEFSPYSTLISGGQATKSMLFYNNARRKIGLVGFWDTVAFDEVGGIKVKDPDTIQIMKDLHGQRALLARRGGHRRRQHGLRRQHRSCRSSRSSTRPNTTCSSRYREQFDLAVMDRFACYLPGWEMPKNSSAFLTDRYGFITDYLAEAFHYQFKHTNRYEEVSKRLRLGSAVEGRDEKGIKKTLCAFFKILHPADAPTDEEFDEYVAYAVECRRRVKEQMNKRKPDDEFAQIDLSFFDRGRQGDRRPLPREHEAPPRRSSPRGDGFGRRPRKSATAVPAVSPSAAKSTVGDVHYAEVPAPAPGPEGPTERHYTIAVRGYRALLRHDLRSLSAGSEVGRRRGPVHPRAAPDRQLRSVLRNRGQGRNGPERYPCHLLRRADRHGGPPGEAGRTQAELAGVRCCPGRASEQQDA